MNPRPLRAASPAAGLELYLSRYHEHLAGLGEALVVHVPTPVAIKSRRGGTVTGVLTSPVWVDYVGLLAPSGRMVALEAKTRTDRVRVCDLEPHQRETLATVDGLGGVAIIYARLADGSDLVVPWGELLLQRSILGGDPRWTRPAGIGWHLAAVAWARYEEGGWPALQE